MISDYHLHTCFSTDSEASVSDVLDAAISKGMKSLCITDHEDMDYRRNSRSILTNIIQPCVSTKNPTRTASI